jgi:uncharacterized membrane protein YdjX (TVP38/TMEM64 family)
MEKPMNRQNIITGAVIVTMLILTIVMTIFLFPILRAILENTTDETVMVNFIYSYGFQGVPVLLGMLILQVIVPFIPSAAIQVLTGLCYGVWRGIIINLTGIVIGNILVFLAVRQSKNLLASFFKKEHAHQHFLSISTISRLSNPERVAFFCFLIPGFPNGIAPYIFAQTKVSFQKYIIAVIAGSIPSTFITTFLGDRISKGSHTASIIIAVLILIIVVMALVFKKQLMAFIMSTEKVHT